MRTAGIRRVLAGMVTVLTALILGAGSTALHVKAASGTVYTAIINRHYSHPITGVIEDSGGEAAYATGQGMVEGCIYPSGIMEVTDDGSYFLTIRMSLTDYTTNHSFQAQNAGDSGWSDAAMVVTGNGSDTSGKTTDYSIQVPSENSVVRGTMYVQPMGRNVIFYLYPNGYVEGNSAGMNATRVTEASGGGSVQPSGDPAAGTVPNGPTPNGTSPNGPTPNGLPNSTVPGGAVPASNGTAAGVVGSSGTPGDSGIKSAGIPTGEGKASTDSTLGSAQGLSLSTADRSADADSGEAAAGGGTMAIQAASMTIAGMIVLAFGAAIVYYFRRNWYRWGGDDDDE